MDSPQILIVEDQKLVAKSIQNELETLGYRVSGIASSGEEAIHKMEETFPDLVLMDIVLKGDLDGIETTRKMRARFDVPVIYLTAYEDSATLQRAKLTEPFGYLLKPYEEKELHTTIEMALYKHRMDQRVKDTERWLSAMLNSVSDAVVATDVRQRVKFLNPAAEAMTGWRADDALDAEVDGILVIVNEETASTLDRTATQALKTGASAHLPSNCELVSKTGKKTRVEGSVAAILNSDGIFIGFIWAVRDISAREAALAAERRVEEQVCQMQKMAAVSRLAGGIAHDFNNQLTVILGNASLALGNITEKDPNLLSLMSIETASLRAMELVKRLLAFSQRANHHCEPLRLDSLVEKILEEWARQMDPGITQEFTSAKDLWTVNASSVQLEEVVRNLCKNACEAMTQGGRLAVETANVVIEEDSTLDQPPGRAGEFVRLRVTDSGSGMTPEVRSQIFEPFFTTKEPFKASGLGLALAFGLVEEHRGWIVCESEPGRGSQFDVYLPRLRRFVTAPHSTPTAPTTSTEQRTILLVDDERMVRELGRKLLENSGYRVLVAEDGVQASNIYRNERQRIDLVLLDLTLPGMTGDDVFQHLLRIDPNVRVLFSSGYSSDHVRSLGQANCVGFIGKPYRNVELIASVRSALASEDPCVSICANAAPTVTTGGTG